ncbi:hypothetical protein DPMN_146465 [Dreissena polymorpha]|uniref:Uncharacterized protein n=1 Tax=Dreissena polymorpha TaxID=45954 RepID=A0A9D4J243_DREPO|nr:hypothetical protein DPMN_146465 [Dreissena polymorpha]
MAACYLIINPCRRRVRIRQLGLYFVTKDTLPVSCTIPVDAACRVPSARPHTRQRVLRDRSERWNQPGVHFYKYPSGGLCEYISTQPGQHSKRKSVYHYRYSRALFIFQG